MMVPVIEIIKHEIQFEESLKQRLDFIYEFSKISPTYYEYVVEPIISKEMR